MAKVQEEEARIRPDVLQAALLHKITKRLGDLTKLVQQQIPEGVVEPLRPVVATTEPQVVKPPVWNKPWFSVSIVNDGPNDCWVVVNTENGGNPYLLKVDESYEDDFKSAKIRDIYVYTDTGTATLRIRGTR